MKRIHMYPHGGSGNHGCEAIVRTSVELLSGNEITLYSENPEQDFFYLKDIELNIKKPSAQAVRFSFKYVKSRLSGFLGNKSALDELYFDPFLSNCKKGDILLSIGGDNYCYGDNEYIYLVNRCLRKKGCKTVLWGCSIEPENISDKMKEDLFKYDLIIARESISYEILKIINKNTLLFPDPAFILKKREKDLPDGLQPKKYIGINVSPLIQSNEQENGIVFDNYCELMEYILLSSDDKIALIPHVVWQHNDDREPLKLLYDRFSESGRVFLIEDQNCMSLKNIIANSEYFIGARTHSTIAAYSSKVPTLVMGYSNKAKGIAKDLFGTYENFVLPVQSITKKNELKDAYEWLVEHKDEVLNIYDQKMDEYINRAYRLRGILDKL